jgi:hypothetical protein
MAPGKINLDIYQGATFRKNLWWKTKAGVVIPLTGYTGGRMQIRETVDAAAVLLELTDSSGITVIEAEGKVEIEVSASVTEGLSFTVGVYDLELINGSDVMRFCEGRVTLHKEVTRD